jgi:hypothetical protein
MSAKYTLVIDYATDTATDVANRLDRASKHDVLRRVESEVHAIMGGAKNARVFGCVASAFASQTVTCSQSAAVDATDVLTVGGVALAVVASPSTTAQFAKGASDTEFAANAALCINTNATTSKLVKASSSAGTLTIMAKVPGPVGNFITVAETGNGFTLGGSTLAGGASDEVDEYTFGYLPTT